MADQDPTTEAPPRPGRRRLLLIVGLVVVIALAGGGGFVLLGGDGAEAEAPEEPAAPTEGVVADVAVLTTSLAGPSGAYVRVGLAVVLAEGVAATEVADRYPLLKDATLSAVSRHTAEELRTPTGQDTLRDELSAAARDIWPDGEVLRVVLTEWLVQ